MTHDASDDRTRRSRRVAIIGAGPGGICTACRSSTGGHDDFVILEQAPGVGGTWFHNRYPGAECDIPSHLYSFSFAPKPDWSRPYGDQPEIQAYLEDVVDRFGLRPHLRLDTRRAAGPLGRRPRGVARHHRGDGEELEVDVVVERDRDVRRARWPDDPRPRPVPRGRCSTPRAGTDDHDLAGERVAVIGSAAQRGAAHPRDRADWSAQLTVFQRIAELGAARRTTTPYSEEQLRAFRTRSRRGRRRRATRSSTASSPTSRSPTPNARRWPSSRRSQNIAVVEDPEVRGRLTPDTRSDASGRWSRTSTTPRSTCRNVELVTDADHRVTEHGIVTADGVRATVDTIILATGFATTKFLAALDVTGRDGVDIDDAWADGAQAYLGITTTGLPEPVHALRPEHQQRVDHLHDRVPGRRT